MSTDTRYNGWTNYETWNVKLWMDNDEGSYRYWNEVAQECYDDAEEGKTFTREEVACGNLSTRLKEEFEEAMPDLGASCWMDLLTAALSEVDWREIAESLLSDVDRSEEETAEVDA
jgi:hypothetical protein